MGIKHRLTSWVVGRAVDDVLERVNVTDQPKRQRVVKAVQRMIKIKKPTEEPVTYGAAITVAVALFAAFGLDLTVEQVAITVTTVVTVVTFVQRRFVTPRRKGE